MFNKKTDRQILDERLEDGGWYDMYSHIDREELLKEAFEYFNDCPYNVSVRTRCSYAIIKLGDKHMGDDIL